MILKIHLNKYRSKILTKTDIYPVIFLEQSIKHFINSNSSNLQLKISTKLIRVILKLNKSTSKENTNGRYYSKILSILLISNTN